MERVSNGVVESVRKDKKGFKIDDKWYSVFAASQMAGVGVGDTVSFSFVTKVNGEYTNNNVKGNVDKTSGTPSAPPVSSGGGASPGGRSFPVHPLAPERSIIRQNSLTHATKLVTDSGCMPTDIEEASALVVSVARYFEAYSSGDLDAAAAEMEMLDMKA